MRAALVLLALTVGLLSMPAAFGEAQTVKDRIRARRDAGGKVESYRDKDGVPTFVSKKAPAARPRRSSNAGLAPTRTVAPTPPTSGGIGSLVAQHAKAQGLKESLVNAVISCESDFDPQAVSKAGACGLMQLMPATAADMGVSKIFDPSQNIGGGTRYLRLMLDEFNGNLRYALAGYNAGPEAVKKYKGIPPYKETQNYVQKVLKKYGEYERGAAVPGPSQGSSDGEPRYKRSLAPSDPPKYMVHFKSGLKQPAHGIFEEGVYYHIRYGKRPYAVRKDTVKEIVEVKA